MGEAAFVPQIIDSYITLCSILLIFLQDFNKPLFKWGTLLPSVLPGKKNEWWGDKKKMVSGSRD